MKSWDKQAIKFWQTLQCLDLGTVLAFQKELGEKEHLRASFRSYGSPSYNSPEAELALIFADLRRRGFDRATIGYIRTRIGEQYTLVWHGFERVPIYSGRRVHYQDFTYLEQWARGLAGAIKRQKEIATNPKTDWWQICDCVAQWSESGCDHTGLFSERYRHYHDRELNLTAAVVGIPVGLLLIGYAFAESLSKHK